MICSTKTLDIQHSCLGLFLFKRGEVTVVEKNISDDMIYNWRNELRTLSDGAFVVASSQAEKYASQGFSKSEVVELLAADNFDLELADRVASNLFNEPTSAQKEVISVAIVPTKYADCIPVIEKSLEKYSAREFVKRLCSGTYSIVKADERGLGFWQRVAEIAKSSDQGKGHLHVALKPWVEEALLNSVLIAQKESAEIKTASSNKYVVSMRKGSAEVDLSNGTSTSEKFTKGNYADFGIADEYIVSAADQVSPYLRLKRALSD